jgi:hypothetical protein
MDEDGHGPFRDSCVIYGDFYRPVFLEEFVRWFVRSADKAELAVLRKAVRVRAAAIRKGGKRGRPRARDDDEWLIKAKVETWQRHILGWSWPQIAIEAGLEPTRPNCRTLQRRQDEFAAMIWRALPPYAEQPERLKTLLESKAIQQLLWVRVGLPFKTHPEECKKIVLALAPRGLKAQADIITRITRTRARKRNG